MKTHEELVAPIVKALKSNRGSGKEPFRPRRGLRQAKHIKNHPKEAGGDNRGPWVRSYLDWDSCDALAMEATDSGGCSNRFEAAERVKDYRSKDFIVW